MKRIAAFLMLLGLSTAYGQVIDPLTLKYAFLDYAAPEVSAGALLSVAPDKVIRAGSTRELCAQLLSAVGPTTSLLPGIGLEFNPFLLVHRDQTIDSLPTTLQGLAFSFAWKPDSTGDRFASGIKWTFADANAIKSGEGIDSSLREINQNALRVMREAAGGRNIVVSFIQKERKNDSRTATDTDIADAYDRLEELLLASLGRKPTETVADYTTRLRTQDVKKLVNSSLSEAKLSQGDGSSVSYLDALIDSYSNAVVAVLDVYSQSYQDIQKQLIQKVREKFLRERWSACAAAVGIGATFRSIPVSGTTESTLAAETVTGYLTGSLGLGPSFLASGMLSGLFAMEMGQVYRPERQATGNVQLIYGSNDLRAMLSAAYQHAKYSSTYQDSLRSNSEGSEGRFSIGFEARISKEFWVYANVGPEWRVNTPVAVWTADYGIRYAPTISFTSDN